MRPRRRRRRRRGARRRIAGQCSDRDCRASPRAAGTVAAPSSGSLSRGMKQCGNQRNRPPHAGDGAGHLTAGVEMTEAGKGHGFLCGDIVEFAAKSDDCSRGDPNRRHGSTRQHQCPHRRAPSAHPQRRYSARVFAIERRRRSTVGDALPDPSPRLRCADDGGRLLPARTGSGSRRRATATPGRRPRLFASTRRSRRQRAGHRCARPMQRPARS